MGLRIESEGPENTLLAAKAVAQCLINVEAGQILGVGRIGGPVFLHMIHQGLRTYGG